MLSARRKKDRAGQPGENICERHVAAMQQGVLAAVDPDGGVLAKASKKKGVVKMISKVALQRRELLTLGLAWATALAVPTRSHADVGGAEEAAKRSRVIGACTKHWAENSGDCSAFVKAVVQELNLGFTLSGKANDICDQISKSPWSRIGVGNASATLAGVAAGEGKIVLAGLAAPGNGHVAVVVDYRNAFDSYAEGDKNKAVGFWGKLHSVGKEYVRITQAWTASDLENVFYAYARIP